MLEFFLWISHICFAFEHVFDCSNFFTLSSSSDVLIHSNVKYFNIIFISNITVYVLLNNCISLLNFYPILSVVFLIAFSCLFVSFTIFIITILSYLPGILSN